MVTGGRRGQAAAADHAADHAALGLDATLVAGAGVHDLAGDRCRGNRQKTPVSLALVPQGDRGTGRGQASGTYEGPCLAGVLPPPGLAPPLGGGPRGPGHGHRHTLVSRRVGLIPPRDPSGPDARIDQDPASESPGLGLPSDAAPVVGRARDHVSEDGAGRADGLTEATADVPPACGPQTFQHRRPATCSARGTPRYQPEACGSTGHPAGDRPERKGQLGPGLRPPGCPALPGARLAKRKLLRPPLPAPQSGLGWGRPLPSRAPSPARDSSNPALKPHNPQPRASWGGGTSGSGLDWQRQGRTEAHTGQEVALGSSGDGVASEGPFPPWEHPARRQGAEGSGRAWGCLSPRAGPREVPGGDDLTDIRASGAERPAGPPHPRPGAPAPSPRLGPGSPRFRRRQPYAPTAGSACRKHGGARGPGLCAAVDQGPAGSHPLLRAQPEPPGWARAGGPAQLPCTGPQEGLGSPVSTPHGLNIT
ncbi:basic proline-rich protein-like [Hippopotamus amphibius kiboko]|uniref:basic proline-rich protein-like n=1 Tax=Hippopotamus amphibius kiboko TaxID=575201 RepID=UPI00259A8EF3|nr:basic proline-rich protein-like [Hippopotamus amphibius kiboko]